MFLAFFYSIASVLYLLFTGCNLPYRHRTLRQLKLNAVSDSWPGSVSLLCQDQASGSLAHSLFLVTSPEGELVNELMVAAGNMTSRKRLSFPYCSKQDVGV